MAKINDLLFQVDDKSIRERLQQEFENISKSKKFGLVFENHLPECTLLHGIEIRKGSVVAVKGEDIRNTYTVIELNGDVATCYGKAANGTKEYRLTEIAAVSQFGDPIYPQLVSVDKIENAPDNTLWHTLIEADNYHALQLLEYLYPKQVDCIYIDPPYNTGAKDWKYNNDYVDSTDSYRHSKWLSMMQRRLKIAKRLLKPSGVIAIAIDHNELAHLVCLLQEKGMFSEYDLTIVSVVHNPRGNITTNFAVTNEYVIYLTPKSTRTLARSLSDNEKPRKLRRWGHYSLRSERPSMFYPLYVRNGSIIRIGEQPSDDFHPIARNIPIANSDGIIEIWPIDQNGVERRWNYSLSEINLHLDRIVALPKDGGLDLFLTSELSPPKTVWAAPELDAGGVYGSSLVEDIVGIKFPYPKSLYTVFRTIEPILREKPNALVVDFFAGSGTTLHAVNLLNAEDGGKRRCVMVTNNEVSAADAHDMSNRGLRPNDTEWEQKGICQAVTWPRSKYAIEGRRADGSILSGDYLSNFSKDKATPRSFFQIRFISLNELTTADEKKKLISLLGYNKQGTPKLIQSLVKAESKYIVSDKCETSILIDDSYVDEWIEALNEQDQIKEFYIITKDTQLFKTIKARIADLLGDYITQEPVKIPIREGFKTNAEYFKLGFLDKTTVELGMQFKAILPMLWLQSGAVGIRPEIDCGEIPDMLIPQNSSFAILVEETCFAEFKRKLEGRDDITYVYLVTDSQTAFQEMASQINVSNVKQLYRDYIDNFTINTRREN